MTDTPLSYQTPELPRLTPRISAAWIATLVLGCLYMLGGLCVGASGVFSLALIAGGAPGKAVAIVALVMSLFFLYVLGTGIILLMGAFRIRKSSRGWAIACMCISGGNALLIFLLIVVGLIGSYIRGTDTIQVIMPILFYCLPMAASATHAVMVWRALGDLLPRTLYAVDA